MEKEDKMQRQGMRQELKQKQTQTLDMVDIQNLSAAAERTAEKLIKKHNGDRNAIKAELLKMDIPHVEGFNYVKEILWVVKWLTSQSHAETKV